MSQSCGFVPVESKCRFRRGGTARAVSRRATATGRCWMLCATRSRAASRGGPCRANPVWDRVYAFARRWGAQGLLAELHDRLWGLVREDAGRDPQPTAASADSQSVRAAATVPASSRGYDAGKKVPGRKRHIVTDCLGLLLVVMVTTASVHDSNAAVDLLERVRSAGAASAGPSASVDPQAAERTRVLAVYRAIVQSCAAGGFIAALPVSAAALCHWTSRCRAVSEELPGWVP